MSHAVILAKLRRQCEQSGSLRKAAIALGVSAAYLSDILSGKRQPGPKILAPLGYSRTVARTTAYRFTKEPK